MAKLGVAFLHAPSRSSPRGPSAKSPITSDKSVDAKSPRANAVDTKTRQCKILQRVLHGKSAFSGLTVSKQLTSTKVFETRLIGLSLAADKDLTISY